VKAREDRPVVLGQVARVVEGAQLKRGDAAVNGKPAVLVVVSKQPGADTRRLTEDVLSAIESIRKSLPADIRITPDLYQQKTFIDLSISNVIEALRDGVLLVIVVLFLFLLNARVTFITLTAIPLSIMITAIVFQVLGMSINTMTLGGLAVAVGELVDDAIVDVENIFRRLRENSQRTVPHPILRVVYEASREVRSSIVFSTSLVVLVFVPLFALGGIEGKLFMPLGLAYIISILASLVVSLTVTPVLSYWLLSGSTGSRKYRKSFVLKVSQSLVGWANRFSIRYPAIVLVVVAGCCVASVVILTRLGRDFLPPFNEGSVQVNVFLPPGTSLVTSNAINAMVDERIGTVEGVLNVSRRTGRAEMDEHAEGVNTSEILVCLDPTASRSREQSIQDIREQVENVPGVIASVEQPLSHLISHMLSGVKAQVGIKLYGDDLVLLRKNAEQIKEAIADVSGVTDLLVEQQTELPQLKIQINREKLVQYGLTVETVNEFIQTAMYGRTVSQIVDRQRVFDLIVRMDEPYRVDVEKLGDLSINLPTGGRVPLDAVAAIREGSGPNTINRENARRRIVIQCNTVGRDLDGVVREIQKRLEPIESGLPPGSFLEYGGQFESQRQATRMIALLSLVSLGGMFVLLYTLFHSVNLSLQVLSALPMAAIGAIGALVLTNQSLTIASMVGFISLCGIASRNGILLIAHYLHLVRHEGEGFTRDMIERAGKERVAPMLMTTLTAGIALVPLVLAAGEPGKEILYPVATVILGGLISSTILDFFVHPALFWCFGMRDAEKAIGKAGTDVLAAPSR
jgi:HME family heavy-metal exporter